jgi:hypothetical protein
MVLSCTSGLLSSSVHESAGVMCGRQGESELFIRTQGLSAAVGSV